MKYHVSELLADGYKLECGKLDDGPYWALFLRGSGHDPDDCGMGESLEEALQEAHAVAKRYEETLRQGDRIPSGWPWYDEFEESLDERIAEQPLLA